MGWAQEWKISGWTSSQQSGSAACPHSAQGNSAEMCGRERENELPNLKVNKLEKCPCGTGETAQFDIWAQGTVQRDKEKEGNAAKTGERAPTGRRGLLATAFSLMTLVVLFISGPLNKTHPWFFFCVSRDVSRQKLWTNACATRWQIMWSQASVSTYRPGSSARGCSRIFTPGRGRSGLLRYISPHQIQSGMGGPTVPCSPTVHKHSAALLCLAQMTAKTSAKAATPACRDVGGPRSAGHQIPVKLPPLPEHRWKGRKLQMLDVIVWSKLIHLSLDLKKNPF